MTNARSLPPLERRTITAALERAAETAPNGPGQADEHGRYTFAELWERSLALGGGLRALGITRGDYVAFMLNNHLDTVHLWFGMSLTGVVEVPVNTAYKGQLLAHLLNDSHPEVVVVEAEYWPRLAALSDQLPHVRTVVIRGEIPPDAGAAPWRIVPFEDLLAASPARPVAVAPDELMAIMYTSGTTGVSKGALLSHCHAYTYASREDHSQPDATDRMLVTLPVFHLGAQGYGVLQAVIHGCYSYIAPRFSVSGFWPLVQRERITMTTMLGAMSELLLQSASTEAETSNPLRFAYMAPLPSDLEGFRARFGVEPIPVYGSTEFGCPISGTGFNVRSGEAGMARSNYDLKIIDESGTEVLDDRPGELLVRPKLPHTVFSGYHNLPEKTAEMIRDGWVHTGDILRRDHEGHYFFADRIKDAMRRRGENISSFEVESAINSHPAVFESAVLAVPSEFNEDEVKAVVVPREPSTLTERDLVHYLGDRLPYFMVPRYIAFAEALPKTPTMKVDKFALRAAGVTNCWDRENVDITVTRRS